MITLAFYLAAAWVIFWALSIAACLIGGTLDAIKNQR